MQALIATGAAGLYGTDPIDGDRGYMPIGQSAKDMPIWSTEKARAYSLAAYRSNPMARAIIDTYTSFICGDSGIAPQCDDPMVAAVVDAWWHDPRNKLPELQPLLCRDWMLNGELAWELMVGERSGMVRYAPLSPSVITGVELDRGNPLWHKAIHIGQDTTLTIANIDDMTGLRSGQCAFHPSWRALITDRRGSPFLTPVLDDLDAYATVLSNLVDRTSIARYLAFDVTIDGDSAAVDQFVKDRGGVHVPRSGTIEVHNKLVEWKAMNAQSGAYEDTQTALSVMTNIAGGSGLAKTWLSESEGANRATSLSMAEPVRRRVGGVQGQWLQIMTEQARFAVDQAVAAGILPQLVESRDGAGHPIMVTPSSLVRIAGPEIAPANAEITSTVMLNLSTAISSAITGGFMTVAAGAVAVQKAWEQLVGRPFPASLSPKDVKTNPDALAEEAAADNGGSS